MIHRIVLLFLMCFKLGQVLAQEERMLVFLQSGSDEFFRSNTLEQLEEYSKLEQIELVVKEVNEALPASITTTPAIVLQTPKGNAIYAGRYAEINTIKNFVRVARINPQRDDLFQKPAVWVKKEGRFQTAIALKVTAMQGDKTTVLQKELEQMLKAGISVGLDGFSYQQNAALQRSDRLFYLDLHPYIDEHGTVYISSAIFSQFSCIDPIDEQFDQPWSANTKELQNLGQEIGQATAAFIAQTLTNSTIGDAWTAVPKRIKQQSLQEMGYPLPEDKTGRPNIEFPTSSVPMTWNMSGAINEKTPIIQFNFLAPLDRYAGEVRKASGSMTFKNANELQAGAFVVDVKSLTMGMESFDAKVLKTYVKAKRYPKSSFEFEQIRLNTSLSLGQTTTAAVNGTFEMMGKQHPVTMNALFTPSVDVDGQAIMIIQADFSLNITDLFGIKGPDGPSPAKKTLSFNLNFLMKATDKQAGL